MQPGIHDIAASERRSGSADIAALAAHLRRSIEHAAQADAGGMRTLEGRLLRRVAGALSAFEAAHGILGRPETTATSSGEGPVLTGLSCPTCGGSEFRVISGQWVCHLLCTRCSGCSRPERHSLMRVDPDTCPGCDFADRCTNRAVL